MKDKTKYVVGDSYSQCRNCGQFHNTTSRDCGVGDEYPLVLNPKTYRVVNGRLYQILPGSPGSRE